MNPSELEQELRNTVESQWAQYVAKHDLARQLNGPNLSLLKTGFTAGFVEGVQYTTVLLKSAATKQRRGKA